MAILLLALLASSVTAFPSDFMRRMGMPGESLDMSDMASLASRISAFDPATFDPNSVPLVGAQPYPQPINDTSMKLVYDKAHPYIAPGPTDQRGPCPGLNTLANHGYLPRSGIVTPAQIVNAVQEGFNFGYDVAMIVGYPAFLVDGNLLTNLMSIGGKDPRTGPTPPLPALVTGLDTHGTFEGDASTTENDKVLNPDNFSFNKTLFQEAFLSDSINYGGGYYNMKSAARVRYSRIMDSMKRNPQFIFETPRVYTAYSETIFFLRYFVDGRQDMQNPQLSMGDALTFLVANKFPDDFHRRPNSFGNKEINEDMVILQAAYPVPPGRNVGLGNYVLAKNDTGILGQECTVYNANLNTVKRLYPNPTGALRTSLKANLDAYYHGVAHNRPDCPVIDLYPGN